jgi:hypothetical protein
MDEADKMDKDCYAICLGLMERGQIVETKSKNIRSDNIECMVIAACNSSVKMPREFLSRVIHLYFPKYTRQEFIDVCVGMLKPRGFPDEVSIRIGEEVCDRKMGDVRTARHIADLMMNKLTIEAALSAIAFLEKHRLPEELEEENRKIQNKRFKRQLQAQLPMN